MPVRPAIIPNLRYADAQKAIAFLRDGFGFVLHAVYADPIDPEIVAHAQLLFNGQMIMLSSAQPSAFPKAAPMLTVLETGGNTQVPLHRFRRRRCSLCARSCRRRYHPYGASRERLRGARLQCPRLGTQRVVFWQL